MARILCFLNQGRRFDSEAEVLKIASTVLKAAKTNLALMGPILEYIKNGLNNPDNTISNLREIMTAYVLHDGQYMERHSDPDSPYFIINNILVETANRIHTKFADCYISDISSFVFLFILQSEVRPNSN